MTTLSARLGIDSLNNVEFDVVKKIYDKNKYIEGIEKELFDTKNIFDKSRLKNEQLKLKRDLSNYLISMENRISYMVCTCLQNMEKEKIDCVLDQDKLMEVGNIYIMLSRWGKFNSLYQKIPHQLLCTGINAGILEDLLYVLRKPKVIGLKMKHIHSEKELVDTLNIYFTKTLNTNTSIRLSFLNYLFKTQTYDGIISTLNKAIHSQYFVRRIGIKQIKGTNEMMYYTYNGLYYRIPYDIRVVRDIDVDYFMKHDSIKYAIHFMKKRIAIDIWNEEETVLRKSLNRKSHLGSVCVIEQSILATPVELLSHDYVIHHSCKNMKKSLNYGLNDSSKSNYSGGLIIDLEKLWHEYNEHSEYVSAIQMNELGLILIHYDIPSSCIVKCVYGEELNKLWNDTEDVSDIMIDETLNTE
jgi:hypothetical protein